MLVIVNDIESNDFNLIHHLFSLSLQLSTLLSLEILLQPVILLVIQSESMGPLTTFFMQRLRYLLEIVTNSFLISLAFQVTLHT